MKNFEYAAPTTEEEALALLAEREDQAAVLAGGTDLVPLMKKWLVTPKRVVNIKNIPSLRGIHAHSQGVTIGAVTTLDELLEAPELEPYPAIKQVIANLGSLQLQCQMTLGGELCRRPQCWYFRNGYGLLGDRGRLVEQGDNRYHAILGNQGPAKFVSPSRLAPALIALGAVVRVAGPGRKETTLPVERLYRTPKDDRQRELTLLGSQLLTHVTLPKLPAGVKNASYEVKHGTGPHPPLATASVALELASSGVVRSARVVMGQVAPVPWRSREAEQVLVGQTVTPDLAEMAGAAAVSPATPLSENAYKVQIAKTAVKRAVLLAAGLETGGF